MVKNMKKEIRMKELILGNIVSLFFCFVFVSVDLYAQQVNFLHHPLYGQKKLLIELDLKQIDKIQNVDTVEISIKKSGEDKIIKSRSIKLKEEQVQPEVVFSMADLKHGEYEVEVVAKNKEGIQIEEKNIKKFTCLPKELEQFKWLDSKEGITDEVLAPWTPIEVKQQKKTNGLTVKVWGREYQFDYNAFSSQIKIKDKSILGSPIRIIAKVDGKTIGLMWSLLKIEKQTPALISFTQEAKGEGLNLFAKTQIEYDGMIRIDWKIIPTKKLKLEELTFEIPMLAKYAKYVYYHGYSSKCGFIPKEREILPFQPMIWLGDEELGLQWFCESDINWYNSEADIKPEEMDIREEDLFHNQTSNTKAMEILSKNNMVILKLNLVNKIIEMIPGEEVKNELGILVMQPASKVTQLTYTFGLQATPLKPVKEDVWDYKIDGGGGGDGTPGSGSGQTAGTADRFNFSDSFLDNVAKAGVKTWVFMENWTDSFAYTSTPYKKEFKDLINKFHKRDIKIISYLGFLMANNIPEWKFFYEECESMIPNVWRFINYPPLPAQYAVWVCYRSVWSDFLAHGIARMIEEYDIDGVYLDSTNYVARGCKNIFHGCGYIDPNARLRKTYAIFPNREIMRRIYTVVKKRKPYGHVNLHNTGSMLSPTMSWATSYWNGEAVGVVNYLIRGLSPNDPLLKKMPLDYFRTEFMGHQWGVAAEFLHYGLSANYNDSLALCLLHDIPMRVRHVISPVWKIFDEFGRKESEWLPYWKNKEYVSVNPDNVDVYVSLYKHPENGVLAVVCNLNEKSANVKVKLNLKNLKLKDKLSASDSLANKPLNITDGELELNFNSIDYKIIWIR